MRTLTSITILLIIALICYFGANIGQTKESKQTLHIFGAKKLIDLQAGNWSHDSIGCNYQCRVNKTMYSWVGENLYKGDCDVNQAYKLWNNSPTHLALLQKQSDIELLSVSIPVDGQCYIILNKANY